MNLSGKKTHGLKHHKLYHTWSNMKARCSNKNKDDFKNYGGRGITVCNDWANDFMSFYNWSIANGWSPQLTIERKDVNGNYEPSNCKWATKKEQARNVRNNVRLTFQGETMCASAWAERLGISPELITGRIKRGWSDERALTQKTYGEAIDFKLSLEKATIIRQQHSAKLKSIKELATEYNVSESLISMTINYKIWNKNIQPVTI